MSPLKPKSDNNAPSQPVFTLTTLTNEAKSTVDKLYRNLHYPLKVLQHFNSLRLNNKFCDVEIVAGGKVMKAHRAILSASCPYFQAMFSNGLIEEQKDTIELHTIQPEILSSLLDFIYTGEIEITQENVQEIIIAADMLELNEVVMGCTEFLKQELHTTNAVGIYRFAEGHNCTGLAKLAFNFILSNFPRICMEEEFYDLPKEQLCDFLASEMLQVDSEFQVFQAAIRWIKHDPTLRKRYVFEILTHVRIPLLSRCVLERAITECSDASLKVALRSVKKDFVLKKGSLVPLYSNPRLCAKKDIFVIGGSKRELVCTWTKSYECTFESVERYDTFRGEWSKASPMGIGRILPGVAALNGRIYVVGGEQDSHIMANGEVYSPCDDTWEIMPCMIVPRCEFGLCALDGVLYAVGGWVGDDIGGSIERYDPVINEWELYGHMPSPKFSMGVVSYEGLIYLVGGCTHDSRHIQDLVSFNPVIGEWTALASMLTPRSQMGVAVLDGFLYVVGGTNKRNEVLQSVERYSFEHNVWSEVPPMTVARGSPAVAAANGFLYVIGGDQTHEINFYRAQVTIASVERFDPISNAWYDCPPLPESRSEAGALVM